MQSMVSNTIIWTWNGIFVLFSALIFLDYGACNRQSVTALSLKQFRFLQECGQSKQVRAQAAKFWKKAGGERIVMAHISRYLEKNSVTNPHFAQPKPEEP